MKKAFLLLMACFLSLTMSAKVAYLLPGSATYKGGGEFSNFDFPEEHDGHNQDPEWNAAYWFYKNYVEPNNGDFITIANFATVCDNYEAIWIHRDLVAANPLGDANYASIKTALQDYVKNGGNLLLTKQAASLLGSDYIGRVSTAIECSTSGYEYWGGECKWTICTNFNDSDNSGHAIYKGLQGGPAGEGGKNVEVTFIPGGKHHTDHNCGIPCDGVGCTAGFGTYQTDNACRILGTWGGDHLDFAGVMEFYPKGDFKGTILMIGIAAYQWTYNNVGDVTKALDEKDVNRGWGGENVLRITKNALNYLNGPSRSDVYIDEDFRADGREGADGDAHNRFMILHPNVRGLNAVAYDVIENAEITEKINDDAARLAFKNAGHVKLQIKLQENRDDQQNWARGIYTFTRDIDFAFNKNVQDVVNSDLSSNGRDGETGKFMLLHPNMQGMDSLGYTISFDGIGEAAEVVKIKDDGATRLAFTKAGQVKLNISLKYSDDYNTEFGKGELLATKTITFAFDKTEPVHGWPDVLNSDVKPTTSVVLYDKTEGLDVTYTFDQEEGVSSWNNETHTITFNKPGTVKIIASVIEDTYTTKWAKKTYTYEKIVTVAYPQSAPRANEDLHLNESQCYPDNTDHWLRLHPVMEGLAATYEIQEAEGEVTKGGAINWEHVVNEKTVHDLVWTKSGAVKLHITFVESRNDQNWPAGTYTFDRQVSFTFVKEEPVHGWPTELDNAKAGQEITLYDKTEGLDVTYTFDPEEAASYNNETHKVTFLKTGEVKITASVTENNYVTTWPKGTYTYDKTITVAAPKLNWSHEPDEAAVMEDNKPAVQATCDVAGLTVKYKSADSKYIEVNETSGAIKFMAPTEGEGIDITAYVTVGEQEFSISKKTRCFAPKADWVARPAAATAHVGDAVAIAGRVRYGAATLGFDCTNCTYSDGKLHFTAEGTATVRPYAEAYGVKYYNDETAKEDEKGEAITITVTYAQEHPTISMETIPSKVWDLFPVTLPATLNGLSVTYSINNERATLAGNVLTYASAGEVTLTAKYVESRIDAPWPADTYTNTKTITMSGYGEVASDADIAYLLPESLDALESIEEKAEFNAAKWFMETYIGAEKKGKFVADLSDLSGIKTLWINVERVGIEKSYSVLEDNKTAVANFVKAGGNVLLTKQATRLAYTSGRMPLEPNFTAGAYFENETNETMFYRERSIATHMGVSADHDVDSSSHRLYNLMLYWDGPKNVYMVAPSVKKTNNYCGWKDLEKNTEKTGKADNTKIACLNDFEAAWDCKVLGIKGHIEDYCYADVVDFAPKGDYKGRIIAVGSSAYQWGESNRMAAANDAKEYKNVMQFTKNAIAYLHGDPLETKTYERTATAGNYSTICYPFAIQGVEGATVYDLVCMSQSGSSIVLEEVEYPLTPGKSYIFLPEVNEVTFTYSGGCVEVIDHSNGMYGNLNAEELQVSPNVYNYILYKNSLYYVDSDNVKLKQYRAYIKIGDEGGVPAYKAPSTPEQAARRRTMGIQGAPSVTTGVANINDCDAKSVRKLMMDGALYIMRDGKMYNVQGQIVK